MNINGIATYKSYQIVTIYTFYKGVICNINEMLDKTEGEW